MCKILNWAKEQGTLSAKCLTYMTFILLIQCRMTTKRTKRSNGYIPDCNFSIFNTLLIR